MATDTIYMTHIQSALSSIKLTNDNLLQQAVVDVMPANGDQPYSGFVTVGREPLCPIYKH
eukprot:352278-Chlamydomonas_euryale.AAC.2